MALTTIRFKSKRGFDCGLIYALYTAKVKECLVVLSDEHQSYEWVIKEEVIERIDYMVVADFIKMI